jgi:hypothetical protein
MRLSNKEHSAISDAIQQADAALGGDIDLLVLPKKINLMAKLDILVQLHKRLGVRKIDSAVYPDTSRPFPRIVMQELVRL